MLRCCLRYEDISGQDECTIFIEQSPGKRAVFLGIVRFQMLRSHLSLAQLWHSHEWGGTYALGALSEHDLDDALADLDV